MNDLFGMNDLDRGCIGQQDRADSKITDR